MLTKTAPDSGRTRILAAVLAPRGALARVMQEEEKNPSQPLSQLIILMLPIVTLKTTQMHTDA